MRYDAILRYIRKEMVLLGTGIMLVEWNGEKIEKKILDACKKGIDEVTGACIMDAKLRVPVRTGRLRSSIRKMKPGFWGSDVEYAIFVEVGTHKMSAQSYLRSAADKNYPQLIDLIKKELR